jgi:hypothetical protein
VIDVSAQDTVYEYISSVSTVDTVVARVTDGIFSDSTSWTVYVEIAGVKDDPSKAQDVSEVVRLSQNHPNPFRPSTTICFTLPGGSGARRWVNLAIHDISGRNVKTVIDSELGPGDHSVIWNGEDDDGKRVSAGIYFCVLRVSGEKISRKMALLN